MGKRKSVSKYRSKRRKFHGYQFTDPGKDCATELGTDIVRPSSADGPTNAADTENDYSCSSAKLVARPVFQGWQNCSSRNHVVQNVRAY